MGDMLFCNIGWMSCYEGLDGKPEQIVGGGKWVNENETGNEECNFLVCRNGYVYGHVETIKGKKDRKIRIEAVGGTGNAVEGIDAWPASLRPSWLSTLKSALKILEHFYVFADASCGQFRDVHNFTALWTGLQETLLDLEKLAVAVELTLNVFFVERITGFGLLQLLDHRRVLLIRLRGSSAAAGAIRVLLPESA